MPAILRQSDVEVVLGNAEVYTFYFNFTILAVSMTFQKRSSAFFRAFYNSKIKGFFNPT